MLKSQIREPSILKVVTSDVAPGAVLKRSILRGARCVLAGMALLTVSLSPALAGPTDESADVLEMRTAPGETTNRVCGANGFIFVQFILAGAVVSTVESSTTCDPGGGNNQDDTGGGNDDTGNVENVGDEEPVFAGVSAQDAANDVDGSASAFLPQTVNGGDVSSVYQIPSPPSGGPDVRPREPDPQQRDRVPQQATRVSQEISSQAGQDDDQSDESGRACDKCREELEALFKKLGPLNFEIAKLDQFINREIDRFLSSNAPERLIGLLSSDKPLTDPLASPSGSGPLSRVDSLDADDFSPNTLLEAEQISANSDIQELIESKREETENLLNSLQDSEEENTKRIDVLKQRLENSNFSEDSTPHIHESFGERIQRLGDRIDKNEAKLSNEGSNLSAGEIVDIKRAIEKDKGDVQHAKDVLIDKYNKEIEDKEATIAQEAERISNLRDKLEIFEAGGAVAATEIAAIIILETAIKRRRLASEGAIRRHLRPDLDRLEALKKEHSDLLAAIDAKEKQCETLCRKATGAQANLTPRPGSIAQTNPSSVTAYASFGARHTRAQRAINQTLASRRQQGLSVSGRDRRVNARFDLRQWRQTHGTSKHGIGARINAAHKTNGLPALFADPKFNLFGSFGGAFGENKSGGLGQDSSSYGMSGGVSYLVIPNLNLGVAGRFGKADIDSVRSQIDASTWGIAGFAQTQIVGINLQATAAWSRTDIGSLFNNAGVVTDADSVTTAFSGQVTASTSFAIANLSISPSASISYIGTERDAFVLSDGQVAPGQGNDLVVFGVGSTFATRFDLFDGALQVSPSVGFGVSDTARDLGNPSLTTSAGLGITGTNGISGNIGLGFAGVTGDTRNISFNGGLTIPLN